MREWLETDGLGGFAWGTDSGIRTRRHHALLAVATSATSERVVLVNGLDAWIETETDSFALTSQAYGPGVVHPDGARRATSFHADPWPRWTFRGEDGSTVEHELFVPHGQAAVVLTWRLTHRRGGRATLHVRLFLSGRDATELHHENSEFRFEPAGDGKTVAFHPYHDVPAVRALSNGGYEHQPDWYRNFVYEEDRAQGDEFAEDLAAPGVFSFDLAQGEAVLILSADGFADDRLFDSAAASAKRLRASEKRRRSKPATRIERAADAYIVARRDGPAIVAGYPWLIENARDSLIAIRGLALATERLDLARAILVKWSAALSEGMLPNHFPVAGEEPAYTSVDASLWYVVAIHEYFEAMNRTSGSVPAEDRETLEHAVESILSAYATGTRCGIRADNDGLLAVGSPGLALTWMNARSGDSPITPRVGKPVEVQALWLSALRIGCEGSLRWMDIFERGLASFHGKFWNVHGGYLYDVVDPNHTRGARDATFRINQVFAVGGLPFPLLSGERGRRVIDEVERRLMTALGPRSLAPGEPGYSSREQSDPGEGERRRHQGNIWPWLTGPFVEGWVRVRGGSTAARREARARFLDPMVRGLDLAGIGHLFEHAEPAWPHAPRGCPFYACSVAEAVRLDRIVLGGKSLGRWPYRIRYAPFRSRESAV